MQRMGLKSLPCTPEEKDQIRTIKVKVAQGDITGSQLYKNEGGHGGTRLPAPDRGQEYREYQLGSANDESRGRRRLVVLTPAGGGSVAALYFTGDHYKTFIEII